MTGVLLPVPPAPPATAAQRVLPLHERAWWRVETGGPWPNKAQVHRNISWTATSGPFDSPEPNSLRVTARHEPSTGQWTSGLVHSRERFPARLPTPFHWRLTFDYSTTHAPGHWGCVWGLGSDAWLPGLVTGRRVWPSCGEPDFIETPYRHTADGDSAALAVLHMGTVGAPNRDTEWSSGSHAVPQLAAGGTVAVAVQIDGAVWTVSYDGRPVARWSPDQVPPNAVWPWPTETDTWGLLLCHQVGGYDPKGKPGWPGIPDPTVVPVASTTIANAVVTTGPPEEGGQGMPLPSSTPKRRVVIRGQWSDGRPLSTATFLFTPVPKSLTDTTAKLLIPTRRQTVKVASGQDSSIDLVCTDGVQPAGWTWRVDTPWDPPKHILVPKGPTGDPAADPVLFLADLLPVPSSAGVGVTRGERGWSPMLAVVEVAGRTLVQVSSWFGGEGTPPPVGFIGNGITSDPNEATNIKGAPGAGSAADVAGMLATALAAFATPRVPWEPKAYSRGANVQVGQEFWTATQDIPATATFGGWADGWWHTGHAAGTV